MHDTDDIGVYNVGYGSDVTIRELAAMISETTGFRGTLRWDESKPDGTPRKLLDSSRLLSKGWAPRISLEEGIRLTHTWYTQHVSPSVAR